MVPDGSDWDEVLGFSAGLAALPVTGSFVFDFANVRFTGPGWMIVVGNALNGFRDLRPGLKRRVENHKGPAMRYAAAAGFFRYFGVDWGHEPGALDSTDAFVPLTTQPVDDLRMRAAEGMMHHGDVIQADAERLVTVLTRLDEGDVFDTLAYSIREIVRNVVEHSEAESYASAAQWWPSIGRAELVVSDAGMGLARSLRRNPETDVQDDETALLMATRPGVTSRRRSGNAGDVWRNTGYGLYMTKGICDAAGSFTLISGSSAMVADRKGGRMVDCSAVGTTVVMTLDTSALGDLSDRLAELRDRAGKPSATPSVASLSKRVTPGKKVSNG